MGILALPGMMGHPHPDYRNNSWLQCSRENHPPWNQFVLPPVSLSGEANLAVWWGGAPILWDQQWTHSKHASPDHMIQDNLWLCPQLLELFSAPENSLGEVPTSGQLRHLLFFTNFRHTCRPLSTLQSWESWDFRDLEILLLHLTNGDSEVLQNFQALHPVTLTLSPPPLEIQFGFQPGKVSQLALLPRVYRTIVSV